MIPVKVEGVRRNFTASSPFLYSAFLIDEPGQHLLVFGLERHEALPIVAALNHLTLPRPDAINMMAETLMLLNHELEEVLLESYSMLPPLYHLCGCRLRWRAGSTVQEQTKQMRAGDAIGLALLMEAPIFASDELFKQIGVSLSDRPWIQVKFTQSLSPYALLLLLFLSLENPLNTIFVIKPPIRSKRHTMQLFKPFLFCSFCQLIKHCFQLIIRSAKNKGGALHYLRSATEASVALLTQQATS